MSLSPNNNKGFTLIELSIVLIIIGLVIGGVLVGRDLIKAAEIRAQISQIEKYHAAVNTFRGKYGYLPGDIPDPTATQYGLISRWTCWGTSPCLGNGDGNSIIEGSYNSNAGQNGGLAEAEGETQAFWVDLSTANLVDGSFYNTYPNVWNTYATSVNNTFPSAKIGGGNYVYVYSYNDVNYFGLSGNVVFEAWAMAATENPGLTVQQAYNIDKKIDDGLPQSGTVTATYNNTYIGVTLYPWWASGGTGLYGPLNNAVTAMGANSGAPNYGPTTNATAGSAITCYDNNSTVSPQHYSTEFNNGNGLNCALSFQFQ